jgi:hypothetical protein
MNLANGTLGARPRMFVASVALLVLVLPPVGGGPDPYHGTRSILESPSVTPPTLSLDPASWWMMVGNVTTFVATWVDPNPGCVLLRDWFRWSLAGAPAEGWLNDSTGPSVNFTAAAVTTGNSTVAVRGAATLDCDSRSTVIVASAASNVTVTSPVSIQNLSVSPNPVQPGETVVLTGNVSGGQPPYTLRVSWGDGLSSSAPLASAGTLSFPHAYEAGEYVPTLFVSDADGLLADASVGEAVQSSDTPEIALTANQTATDVDVPVRFNATVLNSPRGIPIYSTCGGGLPYVPSQSSSSWEFSCSIPYPGPDQVSAEIVPGGVSSFLIANFPIAVAPPPRLTAVGQNLTTEVGVPIAVAFTVAGGIPPFRLTWTGGGPGLGGILAVPNDGTTLVTVRPIDAGSFGFTARLVDADHVGASDSSDRILVYPALDVTPPIVRSQGTPGSTANLTDTVVAGAPPFRWLVAPAILPGWCTNQTGSLGTAGSFAWSATFEVEGATNLTVVVVDASGALFTASLSSGMVALLSGSVLLRPEGGLTGGNLSVDLNLSGGSPPFDIVLHASDGEVWNRTVSSDGPDLWVITPRAGGAMGLRVTVTDALGYSLEWNATVVLPPPPPSRTPEPTPASASNDPYPIVGFAVLGATACAAAAYRYRRRRVRDPNAHRPDAVTVLRRIIEPADGADRRTVELLAEEEGVPLDVARDTIDRLVASGAIRSESTGDGEEVVSWSAAPEA